MQRLGKVKIKVDGETLESMPGASIDIGGPVRTAVNGSNRHLGYSEAEKESRISCEIAVGPQTSLDKIRKWSNVTAVFECDTGQTYVVKEAFSENPPVATGGEGGRVPVSLVGPPAEEVL